MKLALFTSTAMLMTLNGSILCFADSPVESPTSKLINLDTPSLLESGDTQVRLESRFHSHAEDLVYSGGSIRYGFRSNLELGLRGTFAGTSNFELPIQFAAKGREAPNNSGSPVIGHGGSDVELYGKYSLYNGRA